MPKIGGGYILTARKLLESGIMSKPPDYLKVWMFLLMEASHKSYKGLDRGQGITSLDELSEMLSYNIGYRKNKPSRKQVWKIIEWLRNPNEGDNEGDTKETMIETAKVTRGFRFTICNYSIYQDPKSYEGDNEGIAKGSRRGQRKDSSGNTINKNEQESHELKKLQEEENINTPDKKLFLECIRLTDDQYNSLVKKLGQDKADKCIQKLNDYFMAKPDRMKGITSHFHCMSSWVIKAVDEDESRGKGTNGTNRQSLESREYGGKGDGRPFREPDLVISADPVE